MVRAGARNLITDVPGLRVGQAVDTNLRSGVTVLLPDSPARTVVDIRGGAPGTRETDALDPASLGVKTDALVISGGSAFGLDAASGVMAWLSSEGRGFELRPGTPRIPIVPAAVIFDFAGDSKFAPERNPYARLGRDAVAGAAEEFALANERAGFGALARALRPVHTPFDGDTLFALTTANKPLGGDRLRELTRIGNLAADCVSRAVARGVYAAATLGDVKSYRDIFKL